MCHSQRGYLLIFHFQLRICSCLCTTTVQRRLGQRCLSQLRTSKPWNLLQDNCGSEVLISTASTNTLLPGAGVAVRHPSVSCRSTELLIVRPDPQPRVKPCYTILRFSTDIALFDIFLQKTRRWPPRAHETHSLFTFLFLKQCLALMFTKKKQPWSTIWVAQKPGSQMKKIIGGKNPKPSIVQSTEFEYAHLNLYCTPCPSSSLHKAGTAQTAFPARFRTLLVWKRRWIASVTAVSSETESCANGEHIAYGMCPLVLFLTRFSSLKQPGEVPAMARVVDNCLMKRDLGSFLLS